MNDSLAVSTRRYLAIALVIHVLVSLQFYAGWPFDGLCTTGAVSVVLWCARARVCVYVCLLSPFCSILIYFGLPSLAAVSSVFRGFYAGRNLFLFFSFDVTPGTHVKTSGLIKRNNVRLRHASHLSSKYTVPVFPTKLIPRADSRGGGRKRALTLTPSFSFRPTPPPCSACRR